MQIAYCDDEPVQLDYMEKMTMNWATKRNIPLRFLKFESGEEVLFEALEQRFPFDLLIIDIDMKGMNGMELAKKIRETDNKLPIIFLTNRKEYVFEGYEVAAFRYILKPMTEEKMFHVLDEVCKNQKTRDYLIERIAGEEKKIALDEILYAEVSGHYVTVHTKTGTLEWKKAFSELADQLKQVGEEMNFILTHRSFLVNVAEIERVLRTECILSDGSSVPISRTMYQSVNQAFIRYYKE